MTTPDTTPDMNADFVAQVLSAAARMLDDGSAVTDVRIADATGLELPTVRAVLQAEDGKAVELRARTADEPWEVTAVR